jgi:hypothetical protein
MFKRKNSQRFFGIFMMLITMISISHAQITLENSKIRLRTDGKHIISLYDKVRFLEHISSDYTTAQGLLAVSYVYSNNQQPAGTVNSGSITSITLIKSSTSEAVYQLDNNELKATISMTLNDTEAEIIWGIKVEMKNTLYVVSQVEFPRFRTPQSFGGKYKQFVDPAFEGRIFSLQQAMTPFTKSYPGRQSIQMSACISTAGGVMLWTDDTSGQVKSFGYLNSGTSSHIAVRHLMPYDNSIWQSSYNTRMTLCGNQWQDAAEIYRNWGLKQTWSATTLKNRKDVPDILHQVPIIFTGKITVENLTTLPSTLKAWGDLFGTRVIYEPTHWEKYDKYVGIDYFPVSIGNQEYINLNQAFKTKGIVHAGCIEGYHWTKSLTDGTAAQNASLDAYFKDNKGIDLCRTKIDGTLYADLMESRNEVYLCRGTDFGKTFLQNTAYQLFDLGATAIHNDFDQLMALEGPCFNRNHGHPIPYGNWQIDMMKTVYTEIANQAKSRNITDFYLTREWPCEIFNMILQGNQVRNYKILGDPTQIPLYLYVYHDYITSLYGFGWIPGGTSDDELAATLLYGQLPGFGFWQTTIKMPSVALSANALSIMKDYYGAIKTYAKDYLLYGRLLKPAILSAPTTLIHNTWQDDKGNIGVFATNTLTTNTVVSVKIPGTTNKYLNVFNGNTLVSSTEVKGGELFSWDIPKWRLSYLIFSDDKLTANTQQLKKKSINIFPNPVKDVLYINFDNYNSNWEITIKDISGKTMFTEQNKEIINMNHLANGMYVVNIKSNQLNFSEKIIKTSN